MREISNLKFQISNIRRSRRGMTLVEILVVLTIILMVAAATIPRLKPEMDRSRIREAARSIQLYLNTARNQAMVTGKSCGVMIERLPSQNGCSMSLTQVETPPTYGGDFQNSIATVGPSQNPPNDGFAYCDITLPAAPSVPLYQGDLVQIGYQSFWIVLDARNAVNAMTGAISGGAALKGKVDVSHGEVPSWTAGPISGPYKIIRWPTKSSATALQLPSPACIDLTWSGIDPVNAGDSPVWPVSATPVTIMFSPSGAVDRIYVTANGSYGATKVPTSIYLLVGATSKIATVSPSEANINDFTNLWVGINGSTGLISVTELAALGTSASILTPSTNPAAPDSRFFARKSDAMGGK